MNKKLVLTVQCPDRVGVVAAVSALLQRHLVNIIEATHHTDQEEQQFFMRHEINFNDANGTYSDLAKELGEIASEYKMNWRLVDSEVKKKVVLLATKETHCLVDILHRSLDDNCPYQVIGIIANHLDIKQYAHWYKVPFHHVSFSENSKHQAFSKVEEIIDGYQADIVGLAKFMQIVPPELCQKYRSKLINIHHSFLPAFIGSKPYHRAYQRGVKLIGATCHYVTTDLDQGPIIEQDVIRISHRDNIQNMIMKGRDCEKQSFAKGLQYHAQDRVFIFGNKTVVLQ